MQFTITKASDYEYLKKKDFNTLEQLIAWQKNLGISIILDAQGFNPDTETYDDLSIMIYDDYIEWG